MCFVSAVLAVSASAGDVEIHLTLTGGGSLSLAYDPNESSGGTLNGSNQTLSYALPLTVTDSRSNGAGWNITVTSTAFDAGGGRTLDSNAASISSAKVTCLNGNGCTNPNNLIEYPEPMPANQPAPAPIKVFDADRNSGMGMFLVTPTVSVSIPGNAYAGNYVSTVAVALVSGP